MPVKEVQIRRKVEKTHLPTKIMNKSKKAVASVFKDKNPLGITDRKLEKELLKKYLRIDDNDRDYGNKRDTFWKNFRIVVPIKGAVLEVGYEEEDGEIEPYNLEDFITYKWLQNHPQVAKNQQEMESSYTKEFYIHDPVRESQRENVKVQKRKEAYIMLHELSGNEEKLNIVTKLLIGLDPDTMTNEEKENHLDKYINDKAKKFVDMVSDPDLEIRAEIDQMVEKGILRKQGASYLYMDTTIGDSIGEAISYFKNDRNSEVVLDLKSKLKDIL